MNEKLDHNRPGIIVKVCWLTDDACRFNIRIDKIENKGCRFSTALAVVLPENSSTSRRGSSQKSDLCSQARRIQIWAWSGRGMLIVG